MGKVTNQIVGLDYEDIVYVTSNAINDLKNTEPLLTRKIDFDPSVYEIYPI